MENDELGELDPVEPEEGRQRRPAVVHEGLGLEQQYLLVPDAAFADEAAEFLLPGREAVDFGDGIDAIHLPRLTERFYRVDRSRSRETGGTGLGLAIVKHVVQRHGGGFDVQSVVGQGSAFSVILPALRVRQREASGLRE